VRADAVNPINAQETVMVRQSRFELSLFGVLAIVMLVTRTHSLSNLVHLPDTSLASFFVLGLFVPRLLGFAALFLLGLAIDLVVIGWFGQSSFCFTPAYWMLVPAYGVMWLAGRVAERRIGFSLAALPAMTAILVGAAFASQLLSSGGFYFLGGRFAEPTLAGFLPRMARYFPGTLLATLGWSGLAAIVFAMLFTARPGLRTAQTR
jgi:hypothetical protein